MTILLRSLLAFWLLHSMQYFVGVLGQMIAEESYAFNRSEKASIDRHLQSLLGPDKSTTHEECITVEMVGRLGNLMFQYAAMVGYCRRRGLPYETCAHLTNPKFYDPELPIRELTNNFHIRYKQSANCKLISERYTEHAYDVHAMLFDKEVMTVKPGTMIIGYLQSWRYFHPHAEKDIRKIFSFRNEEIATKGLAFISDVRDLLPSPGYKVVAVHVRLGDKANNTFYNSWSLSEEYYKRAITLLNERHGGNVALVFFTGGAISSSDAAADEKWTESHYGALNEHVFFESSGHHLVAMQSMMACDAIIVGHSSYSWWAAYLSASMEIVAPKYMFPSGGPGYRHEDYYLPWWSLLAEDPNEDRIIGINPF